jgi:hypothetical protein
LTVVKLTERVIIRLRLGLRKFLLAFYIRVEQLEEWIAFSQKSESLHLNVDSEN